jgi:NAD(P)-dependent dehydrogenase (short-subunit alcohol dehydrogenase family)
MKSPNPQTVIVTGAVGNLGKSTTAAFQSKGANLVLVDRSYDRLCEIFPDLVEHPQALLATCTDMLDPEKVGAVVAAAQQQFGRVDVLAHTVGGFRAGHSVLETPIETWDFLINLNVKTALIAAQQVLPVMQRQGYGKIVYVAARTGLAGSANAAAYSAAKAGLIRLVESLSKETRRSGINVNCILPGTIDTPQNRSARPEADPANWVSTDSLAGVIAFLASQAAQDIHGAAVPVYGLT